MQWIRCSGLSWLLLEGRTEDVQELGAGAGCSGVIRGFSTPQAEKDPNSSHISCNYSPLCVWNKEGLGRFKAADRVELDFTAKNSQTQQL